MTCKEALNRWDLSAYRGKITHNAFYIVSTSGVWATVFRTRIKWFKTCLKNKKSLIRFWNKEEGNLTPWSITDEHLLKRIHVYGWMFNDPFSHRHKHEVRDSDSGSDILVPAFILGAENTDKTKEIS